MKQNFLQDVKIGVIGGSGIYEMDDITQMGTVSMPTPFGNPSDTYRVGRFNGVKVAFLPRHGEGHRLLPSEINYRANLFGFKKLGVTHILAMTAVGSLQENIHPLDIVIPDQLIDRTYQRKSSFFGHGLAAHIPFAEPFCPELSHLLFTSAEPLAATVHRGGTLVNIEGPAFSTRAESRLYQKWGIDIIGMTTIQEAKLAREAEICYAAMAMVTDDDGWKKESEIVCVETIVANLTKNAVCAAAILRSLLPRIARERTCPCKDSLNNAIMTQRDHMDEKTRQSLWPLIEKYIDRPKPVT